jgi:hypothetical protein
MITASPRERMHAGVPATTRTLDIDGPRTPHRATRRIRRDPHHNRRRLLRASPPDEAIQIESSLFVKQFFGRPARSIVWSGVVCLWLLS